VAVINYKFGELIGNKFNIGVARLKNLIISNDSTNAGIVRLYINGIFSGSTIWNFQDQTNSGMLYDTNNTSAPTNAKTFLTTVLGSSDTLSIDLSPYGLTL
jgi:hypothetical protein